MKQTEYDIPKAPAPSQEKYDYLPTPCRTWRVTQADGKQRIFIRGDAGPEDE